MVLILGALMGCSTEAPTPSEPAPPVEAAPEQPQPADEDLDPRVAKAATVAKAITQGTEPAEAIAAEGLTPSEFRDLLYEIAADPQLAAAYNEARQ